ALAIDVGHTQLNNLRNSEASRVCSHEDRSILNGGDGGEELSDLGEAQHDREFPRLLGERDVLDDPVLAQCDAIKESKSANRLIEDGPRYPFLMHEEHLV